MSFSTFGGKPSDRSFDVVTSVTKRGTRVRVGIRDRQSNCWFNWTLSVEMDPQRAASLADEIRIRLRAANIGRPAEAESLILKEMNELASSMRAEWWVDSPLEGESAFA
jgi:hypothetical protein